MKKTIMLMILAITVFSCSLLDEVNREDAERGRECYRTRSGYFYCKNTK